MASPVVSVAKIFDPIDFSHADQAYIDIGQHDLSVDIEFDHSRNLVSNRILLAVVVENDVHKR